MNSHEAAAQPAGPPDAELPPEPAPEAAGAGPERQQATAAGTVARPRNQPESTTEPLVEMPPHIFVIAVTYLMLLIAGFIIYATSPSVRSHLPSSFGQLPAGVVWFGSTGAVIASLYGIFMHNKSWKMSYNYWHYCRPVFGSITGSIGALIYLVLLNLGNTGPVKVDSLTFYVVAFVIGFADKTFMQLLQNVTSVIIKPGKKASDINT